MNPLAVDYPFIIQRAENAGTYYMPIENLNPPDRTEIVALVALIVTLLGLNFVMLQLIDQDRIKHPRRWAFGLNILLMFCISGFVYFFYGIIYALISFLFPLLFISVFIFLILPSKDEKGIKYAEQLIVIEHLIDLQLNYILAKIYRSDTVDNEETIDHCLSYILNEIVNFLNLKKQAFVLEVSLLLVIPDGKFEVLQTVGIPMFIQPAMLDKFRHGDETMSIAGEAVKIKDWILINDLRKDTKYDHVWVSVDKDRKKEGSIICMPIFRGVGDETKGVMAVICVSTDKKDAFDRRVVPPLLTQLGAKIESILYIRELIRL